MLRPSTGLIVSFASSMPSMQLTLSATTSLPSGFLPRANTSTPQSAHIWWRMACLLKRYSFRLSSPASRRNRAGSRKVKCSPFLVQIEQLHAVTIARSAVHSNRTMPQLQPPVYVFASGIAGLLWRGSLAVLERGSRTCSTLSFSGRNVPRVGKRALAPCPPYALLRAASRPGNDGASLPGLTRQSIIFERLLRRWMDTRVKPADDAEHEIGRDH